MAIAPLAFDPSTGWNNSTSFPTNPETEAAARLLLQELHDQTRDFVNGLITTLAGTGGAAEIGVNTITGLTGETVADVQAALAALYAKFANYVATSVVETTLTNSATKIPSSSAVTAAMATAGLGDMLSADFATNGATGKVDSAVNADQLGSVVADDYATKTYAEGLVPTVPTKVSDLTNDSAFITANGYVSKLKGSNGTTYTFYGALTAAQYAARSGDADYATTIYLVPIA